ncbi:MAG: epoxyqueuosine reductase QueH [Bacilli bacterium]|nr:epoxyqueuosine reductase QueH [Bacilli bacterium]
MNYQKKLEEMLQSIKNSNKRPSLLLHACCGPCSSYVLEYLSNYFDITIYYYNPNIYPIEEYTRRKEELKTFVNKFNNKIKVIEELYNPDDYYKNIKGLERLGEKSKRCYKCYEFRLDKTAKYAKENNYDYFTTTLSISPYKNADWLNEIGKNMEEKYNIDYLFADFKKKNGYKRSLELSKEYKLYRQDYCGCVYSKQMREAIINV